jgi:hypothetical protein
MVDTKKAFMDMIKKNKSKSIPKEKEGKKENKLEKGKEEPVGKMKGINTSLKSGLNNVMSGKCPDCGKSAKNCNC